MRKIKFNFKKKAGDAMIKVSKLSSVDQKKIHELNPRLTFVSYDTKAEISRVVDMIDHGHSLFMGDEIRERFKKEPDEVFQYLSKLNDHDLWIEINRDETNVKASEPAQKYLLGLRRFAYHHASKIEDDRDIISFLPADKVTDIFHYRSLNTLVNHIRKKVEEVRE